MEKFHFASCFGIFKTGEKFAFLSTSLVALIVVYPDGDDPIVHPAVSVQAGEDGRDDLVVLEVSTAFSDNLVAQIGDARSAFAKEAAFCGFPRGVPVAKTYVGRGYVAPGAVVVKGTRKHWVQIETDDARRGMSGGPVVQMESGRVIGLISERNVPDPGDDLAPTCWAINAGRLLHPPYDIPFVPDENRDDYLTNPPQDLTLEQLLPDSVASVSQAGLPHDFVGRSEKLAALNSFWKSEEPDSSSKYMIYGLPWVGKSSLVEKFALTLATIEAALQPDIQIFHSFDDDWAVEVFFDNLRKLAPAYLAGKTAMEVTNALKPLIKANRILVVLDALENHQLREPGKAGRISDPDLSYFIQAFEAGSRSRLILLSRIKPDAEIIDMDPTEIHQLGGLEQSAADDLYRARLKAEPPTKWAELCTALDRHAGGLATVLSQISLDQGLDLDWALRIAQKPVGDDPLVVFENLLADLCDGLDAEERTVMLALSQFSGDVSQNQLQEVLEVTEYEIDDELFSGISCNKLPLLYDRLETSMLLESTDGKLHVHAFVKRFFARRFVEMYPDKQKNIHRRIAATFRNRFNPPANPTELEDLLPGLEAVIHSCKAGDVGHALRFLDNDVQGPNKEYRLSNKLGAVSAFWRVLTHFFQDEDTDRPALFPDGAEKDSLLHSVGYCQSVLGAEPWSAFPILRDSARGLSMRGSATEASEVFRSAAHSAASAGELKKALEMLTEASELQRTGDAERTKILIQTAVTSHMAGDENWAVHLEEVSKVLPGGVTRRIAELLPRNSLFVLVLARAGHLDRYDDLVEELRNKAQERGWQDIAARHSSIIANTSEDRLARRANAKLVTEKISSLGRVDLIAELVIRHARYLIGDGLPNDAEAFLQEKRVGLPLDQYPLLKLDFEITLCACSGRIDEWEPLAAECRRLSYAWGAQDIEKYRVDRNALLV